MIHSALIRKSAEFIANHATDVLICDEKRIEKVAVQIYDSMRENKYSAASWHNHRLVPKHRDHSTVNWIFVVDLLNFSFWSDEPYHVECGGHKYTGYWSLCAAINRALAEGIPITEPRYYASASNDELRGIFRTDEGGAMPMVEERVRLLRETGQILMAKFDGSIANVIRGADTDPFKLMSILCCNFHSFLDVTTYLDRPADLWACFDGESFGRFRDVDKLTMFADYRLPQMLQVLGLISFAPNLQTRLDKHVLLNVHDNEVVEIRGCSVHVVELLATEIKKLKSEDSIVNSAIIDFFLWDLVKEHPELGQDFPIHRTRSCFY